jgi:hypothetical protein
MRIPLVLALVTLTACAAAPAPEPLVATGSDRARAGAPAPTPAVTDAIPAPETPAPERRELPTSCASSDPLCTPPAAFAERLCSQSDPDLALTLFHKSTPWTRAYVVRDMEAWYVGGRSRPAQLHYAEEVLVVADRAQQAGGMRVSGAGSYDVYRWDGTCVSLMSDEVSLRRPSEPEVAPIPWRKLDDDLRDVLTQDRRIAYRHEKQRESCKEDWSAPRCERALLGLSHVIADYVRGGGELPAPKRIP